ncbi:hypothetical protein KM043_018493 [Ampulex compressa]|nr:hypothetical protein KM043_018493 [Ampulex compressa]
MLIQFLWFCIHLALLLPYTDTKILQGQLITRDDWAFLARFCFSTEEGTFQYQFILGGQEENLKLLLYYDSPHQWPSVYATNKTCEEKVLILSNGKNQVIPLLTSVETRARCVKDDNKIVRCSDRVKFRSSRPRWWFIALADCDSMVGLNVSYWISLTNAPPGSFWKEHFSADEFCILPELVFTACIYTILVIFSFYIAYELRSRRLLHVSYKLFMASMICQLLGLIFEMYSYIHLGLKGILAGGAFLLGYGLIALKLIAWIIFVMRCFKTAHKMTTKLHFYGSLISLGSVWFLCQPLTVLSITLLLDEWPIPVFHSILEPVRLFQSVVKDRIIVMKYAHEQQPLYLPFHICLHLSRNHSIKRLLRSNSI